MKLLAISDTYIPADLMKKGLSSLQDINIDVEVRHWAHDTLELLQAEDDRESYHNNYQTFLKVYRYFCPCKFH